MASVDLVVLGLGNPGSQYRHTRHNVGADTIEVLGERYRAKLRLEKGLFCGSDVVTVGGQRIAIAIPTTYMNESGLAAAALMRRFDLDPAQLVVIHDELDLSPATVKLKEGGGLAGNNGLRSIKAHTKTEDFLRIRIGIGKPVSKEQGVNHVLNKFGKREREEIDIAIARAADAVEAILANGIAAAMNEFNTAR